MPNISDVERGQQLQALRKTAQLTQRSVAGFFEIDKGAVSEWERGKSRPTMDKLATLDSLYGGTGAVFALYDVGKPTATEDIAAIREMLRALTVQVLRVVAKVDDIDSTVVKVDATVSSVDETVQSVQEIVPLVRAFLEPPKTR